MTSDPTLKEILTDAIAYWEKGRIVYNLTLACVVVTLVLTRWDVARERIGIDNVLGAFMLFVLTNVLYCSAYIVDVVAQLSAMRQTWRKYRVVLFIIGTIFGSIHVQFIVRNALK